MSRDDRKRAIGQVVSVSADRFVVEMHAGTDNFTVVGFDDVHYVARLGSFLMIPVQTEYVVVEVVGLRERDITTTDRANGALDKAASAKYLDVVPIGMLPQTAGSKFRFGVSIFPSLYADALYALDAELDRVFETDVPREPARGPDGEIPDPANATRFRALSIGRSVVLTATTSKSVSTIFLAATQLFLAIQAAENHALSPLFFNPYLTKQMSSMLAEPPLSYST